MSTSSFSPLFTLVENDELLAAVSVAVAEDVVAVVPTELSAVVPEARALLVVEHPVSASAASKVTEVAEVSIFLFMGKESLSIYTV